MRPTPEQVRRDTIWLILLLVSVMWVLCRKPLQAGPETVRISSTVMKSQCVPGPGLLRLPRCELVPEQWTGTGVIVARDGPWCTAITCAHCLQRGGTFAVTGGSNVSLFAFDSIADLAALRFTAGPEMTPCQLGADPGRGETLSSWRYEGGAFQQSNARGNVFEWVTSARGAGFDVGFATRGGGSGGGVFGTNGLLRGIMWGSDRINRTTCIPVSKVLLFMRTNNIVNKWRTPMPPPSIDTPSWLPAAPVAPPADLTPPRFSPPERLTRADIRAEVRAALVDVLPDLKGKDGKDGKDGDRGGRGLAGKDGKDGKDGGVGLVGPPGATGPPGAPGVTPVIAPIIIQYGPEGESVTALPGEVVILPPFRVQLYAVDGTPIGKEQLVHLGGQLKVKLVTRVIAPE